MKHKISTHLKDAFLPNLNALLTDLMPTNSPSTEVNTCSASQEIPCLLWNTKIHYCAFKNLSLVILSQMNPVHLLTPLLTDDLPVYVFDFVSSLFPCSLRTKILYVY
jgi:hypothetical protein